MRSSSSAECPVSLVLYFQPIRSDIYLQSFRLFFGLVKIVAEHGRHDDQSADDEEQAIAIAGHPVSPWGASCMECMAAGAILKAIQAHDPRSRYVRHIQPNIFADRAPANPGKV
jgi:hypothetical protein